MSYFITVAMPGLHALKPCLYSPNPSSCACCFWFTKPRFAVSMCLRCVARAPHLKHKPPADIIFYVGVTVSRLSTGQEDLMEHTKKPGSSYPYARVARLYCAYIPYIKVGPISPSWNSFSLNYPVRDQNGR